MNPTPDKATLADMISALTTRHGQLGQAIAQAQSEQLVVQGQIQALEVMRDGKILSDVTYSPKPTAEAGTKTLGGETHDPAAPVPRANAASGPEGRG